MTLELTNFMEKNSFLFISDKGLNDSLKFGNIVFLFKIIRNNHQLTLNIIE